MPRLKVSSQDRIYSELRKRIMAGFYSPGTKLREEHIASEMSVSRTPVRAAIQRLVKDGLVKNEENKGAEIIGLTDRDLGEIFDLRMLLEPYVASVAAEQATEQEIKALEMLNEDMFKAIRSGKSDFVMLVQQLNNQFHRLLCQAAHSGRLTSLVERYLDIPVIIGSFYFYSQDDMLKSYHAHKEIVEALKHRNSMYAETAMRLHLTASRSLFSRHRSSVTS